MLRICYHILLLLSGDSNVELTYKNIADRFFIDYFAARKAIAILDNLAAVDINQHMALEGADYNKIRRSPIAQGYYLPQLKLTQKETEAFASALISQGLETQDVILDGVANRIPNNISFNTLIEQSARLNPQERSTIMPWQIDVCALAGVRIKFKYRNNKGVSKEYIVDPLYNYYKEDRWYTSVWDIEADKQKTFVIDKIQDLQPAGKSDKHPDHIRKNDFIFEGDNVCKVTFKDGKYYEFLGHSNLKDYQKEGEDIVVSHTCINPIWIVSKIAASDGQISTNNEDINQQAREYAAQLLEKAKSL